jgi:amidase
MEFQDYRRHDGVGLAAEVAAGRVDPESLLSLAAARAEAVNPQLKAIVIDMMALARERVAGPLSGPFAGVPFLIKDILQDHAGVPSTAGSRAFRQRIAPVHAHMVRRWLDAGLVIFGKTATPELALKGHTESALYGATRNPWNLALTPGGSSGGAAAAVAAGIVPMAGANDGGGSIRIPAAMCGLVGLRPSRGRVSVGPAQAEVWEGANSDGIVCRSLRDAAHMLDVMAGPEPGEPYPQALPAQPWAQALRPPERPLRIAFTSRSPIATPVDPEAVAAVQTTARWLEALGHQVEEAEPEIDGRALAQAFFVMYFGQTAATVGEALAAGARASDFELDTRALALIGETLSAGAYVRAHQQWNGFGRRLAAFYERYDLFLTPTLAQPPAAIGSQQMPGWQAAVLKPLLALGLGRVLTSSGAVEPMAEQQLARVPFTQLANLTGTPSLSLPLHQSAAGLPIGMLFNAPMGREDRLLQLGVQLEAAHPWFDRIPAL